MVSNIVEYMLVCYHPPAPAPASLLPSFTFKWRRPRLLSTTTFHHRRYLSSTPICDGDEHHFIKRSPKYWDDFYKRHQNKFFKDRHYSVKDWGRYFSNDQDGDNRKVVLEVGCGPGNTIYPLLDAFPNLYVHACDFSPQAISLVKIFTLSAFSPKKMSSVLQNLKRVLKPNGYILFRDYAIGDSAQVKLQKKNQLISDNFYFRGDGTCSFFFSEDFLSTLFSAGGLNIMDVSTYYRKIENRSKNITMQRYWIRGIFRAD